MQVAAAERMPADFPLASRYSFVRYLKGDATSAQYAMLCREQVEGKKKRNVVIRRVQQSAESQGFPLQKLRELAICQSLRHPNIVHIKEILHEDESLYYVSDYIPYTLKNFIYKRGRDGGWDGTMTVRSMDDPHRVILSIKYYMYQLLQALAYLHDRRVIHRNLKPRIIRVDGNGTVKLEEFKAARTETVPGSLYSSYVVSRWYMSPEMLLGQRDHSAAIDMWSVGCILGECYLGRPLFPGETHLHQIFMLFQILGVPNENIWKGVMSLPEFNAHSYPCWNTSNLSDAEYETRVRLRLQRVTPHLDRDGADLLARLLYLNPAKRITAKDALRHPFFKEVEGLSGADARSLMSPAIRSFPDESEEDGELCSGEMEGETRGKMEVEDDESGGVSAHSTSSSPFITQSPLRRSLHSSFSEAREAGGKDSKCDLSSILVAEPARVPLITGESPLRIVQERASTSGKQQLYPGSAPLSVSWPDLAAEAELWSLKKAVEYSPSADADAIKVGITGQDEVRQRWLPADVMEAMYDTLSERARKRARLQKVARSGGEGGVKYELQIQGLGEECMSFERSPLRVSPFAPSSGRMDELYAQLLDEDSTSTRLKRRWMEKCRGVMWESVKKARLDTLRMITKVHSELNLDLTAFFAAARFFDMVLWWAIAHERPTDEKHVSTYGLSCLVVASKLFDPLPPPIEEFASVWKGFGAMASIQRAEFEVLQAIKLRVLDATLLDFIGVFAFAQNTTKETLYLAAFIAASSHCVFDVATNYSSAVVGFACLALAHVIASSSPPSAELWERWGQVRLNEESDDPPISIRGIIAALACTLLSVDEASAHNGEDGNANAPVHSFFSPDSCEKNIASAVRQGVDEWLVPVPDEYRHLSADRLRHLLPSRLFDALPASERPTWLPWLRDDAASTPAASFSPPLLRLHRPPSLALSLASRPREFGLLSLPADCLVLIASFLTAEEKVRLSAVSILCRAAALDSSHWKLLDLSNCVHPVKPVSFFLFERNFRNLERISFGGCKWLTSKSLACLLAAVHTNLRGLDLNSCMQVTDKGVQPLLKGHQLQEVDFSQTSISKEMVKALVQQKPENIRACLVGSLRVEEDIVSVLTHSSNLQLLCLASATLPDMQPLANLFCTVHSLQKVDLGDIGTVDDRTIIKLAENNPMLRWLSLSFCDRITDDAIKMLAKHCSELRMIDLCLCGNVTEEGIDALADGCLNLEELNVGRINRPLTRGLLKVCRQCTSLRYLSVHHQLVITYEFVVALTQDASLARGLEFINLYSCPNVTDASVAGLRSARPELEVIYTAGVSE